MSHLFLVEKFTVKPGVDLAIEGRRKRSLLPELTTETGG
ncbi:hypothetical protein CSC02_2922 [Enterobacter hormaechei subsp. hoffmannii]|nr:hypothetical protein CSC02_2922 [Enterobacter hormaechei subsp. hoffmannii]